MERTIESGAMPLTLDENETIRRPSSETNESRTSEEGDDNDNTCLADSNQEENPAMFRRPILTNKTSSCIPLDINDPSSHPGAFRIAGMNQRAAQRNSRDDAPAEPVPLEDMSNSMETVEEPVAALTAVMVETPVMVDSDGSFPRRRRFVVAWCILLLVVLVTIVFSTSWFLRPEDRPFEQLIAPTLTPTISPTSSSRPGKVDWLLQNDISEEAALSRKGSPQSKAVTWWASEENLDESLQRYVLAVFYYAMGGDQWKSCGEQLSNCGPVGRPQNWLNHETSECDWIGVSCDETGMVIGLDFEAAESDTVDLDNLVERKNGRVSLDGEVPPEIRHLTSLQEFVAPDMNVQGSLELWKDLAKLRVLNVERGALEGTIPPGMDVAHPALEVLRVAFNNLTGTLPNSLPNMNGLQVLDFESNQLNGTIPLFFGLSPNLEILRLSSNKLRGQVPLNLFYSQTLKQLVLGDNEKLTGSIPAIVGNMTALQVLDLHMTRMDGEVPAELFTLSKLQILDLSHAQFDGVLTDGILSLCNTLRVLRLNDNENFSGNVPTAMDECTQLEELVLTNTSITGEISESLCSARGTSTSKTFHFASGL